MRKIKKGKIIYVLIALIPIFLILIGILINSTKSKEEYNILLFYHQWLSVGEQAALNGLIDSFLNKYPEIIVLPIPVVNKGLTGGVNALFSIVKPMIFSKEPPDTFQLYSRYEAKVYYDAGLLKPLDELWELNGLEKTTPKIIKSMCKFNDVHYAIPIGVHRTNLIWYNKKILDKNKINPETLTNWDSFFNACEQLRKNGIKNPIQIGSIWATTYVFEQIIASQGIEFYEDWINGKITSADDPRLIESLEIFKKYLDYSNSDYEDIEWNEGIIRVINGESAFSTMGDWANGEFKVKNKVYDEDYGTIKIPETNNMYGMDVDMFLFPKNTKHPKNTEKWLEFIGTKEGQDVFNPLKGSISVRMDQDVNKYDLYQRLAILDFLFVKYMFPAIADSAPKEFETGEQEIMLNFIKERDINKTSKEIADFIKSISKKYTINWDLN